MEHSINCTNQRPPPTPHRVERVIRAMIDEEGLSITDASARLGISRQAGARLYRSEGDHPATPSSEKLE
jgi:hypothetical protein